MNEEMQREVGLYPDYEVELVIKDANNSNQKQKEDIKELLKMNIDLLIVSPNEAEPLTGIVEDIYDMGIPVIVIDRKINSNKYTAYIGADNLAIGRAAGLYATSLLDHGGTILEITGLNGSTPAIERSMGFRQVVERNPSIVINKVIEGRWLRDRVRKKTDSLFTIDRSYNLVFAHNDRMAYGTYLSARKNHYKPFILGVDGLNIPNGGIDLVLNGTLDATFLYSTGGDKAIQLAMRILTGASYDKINTLNTTTIDHTNARIMKAQGEQIMEQNVKIDRQLEQMDNLAVVLKKRNTFLLLSIASILFLMIIVGLIFSFLRQKERVNKKLAAKNITIERQNDKIIHQRDHLVNVLKMAEEATELKLRYFTNISHEFRNMLNLITIPIEELAESIQGKKNLDKIHQVQRSTERLLRLSNEIQGFRKLDKQKYILHFRSGDLGLFIINIVDTLRIQAEKNNLTLDCDISNQIWADFDPDVIEKVMYNLLTNAIKYTQEGGKVRVKANMEKDNFFIHVEDNGRGISQQDLPYVFDRFFRSQNENESESESGSGIGLALSRELIQLHQGDLLVKSKPGEGSVFTIKMPRFHVKPSRKSEQKEDNISLHEKKIIPVDKDKTILIVEDMIEILSIIAKSVSKYYSVLTAENGKDGFELAKKTQPDLIVSDILMPVKDGIEMCREIKKNPNTFHIPVILLTALDSQEATIQGFDIGADDYMTKPFSESLLISRIQNLLESRKKLNDSFGKSMFISELIKHRDNNEQQFIQRCIEIINENIRDESFKLSNLAENLCVSRSFLYRKIKEITGLRAVDFMKKAKLQYASRLLMNEDLTIAEISWQSGFSDPKYFSKIFSQEFGKNPSVFRKISQEESNKYIGEKQMNTW
jgi:signal transduction histidine kinase/DNA-binding response OmpR family regulator